MFLVLWVLWTLSIPATTNQHYLRRPECLRGWQWSWVDRGACLACTVSPALHEPVMVACTCNSSTEFLWSLNSGGGGRLILSFTRELVTGQSRIQETLPWKGEDRHTGTQKTNNPPPSNKQKHPNIKKPNHFSTTYGQTFILVIICSTKQAEVARSRERIPKKDWGTLKISYPNLVCFILISTEVYENSS